ncbi:unnamed protein product [Scytosiphon promiscuus]
MPPKPGSKNGGTATAETGPLRGTASPSGAFDSGRAPTSTTPVGPRASHAIHPIKVATVASRDAWFSSPSGRPSGSGEIAAELAALAATRGASSRLLGDATRASKDLQLAGEGCVRSGRSKTADSYVNSVAGRIAGRGTKKTEEVVAKPPPPYLGVLGTAAAVPKQRNEAGLPPPFDAAAVGAPPPLQPPQTSQSSPSAERSISLNAATTLGVSAPDLAGGDESTPKAAEASSAAADVTAAPAPVEVEVVTPAPTAAAAAAATAAQATPTAAAAATTADRSASLTETDGGKKKPPQKLPSFGKALSAGMPTDLLSRWRSSKKVKSPPADNAGETTPASADAAAGAGGRGRTARTPFRRRGSSKQRRHSLPPRGSPADGAQSPAAQLPGGGGAGGSSKSSFPGDGVAAAASAPILAPPPRAPGRARSRAPGAVAPAPRSVLPVVTATPTATTAPGFPAAAAGTTADDSLQGQERNAGEGPAAEEEEQRSAEEEHREEDEPGQEPVAVIGQTMSLKGLLECGRSVKMEGSFSGDIVSTGDVIVAPTGKIAGDLKGLKFLLVEGEVVGDVVCDKVMVVGSGKVFGDITSVSIKIGPQATMRGRLNVVKDLDDLLQAAAAVDDKVEEADEKVEEDSGDDAKVALDLTKGEGTVEGAAEVAPADAAADADVDANDDDAGAATADAPAAPAAPADADANADADADADTGAPADADADAPADASAPADAPADATAVAVDANELAAETFTDSDGESEVSSEAQQ